jgi:hypothetical protein
VGSFAVRPICFLAEKMLGTGGSYFLILVAPMFSSPANLGNDRLFLLETGKETPLWGKEVLLKAKEVSLAIEMRVRKALGFANEAPVGSAIPSDKTR